MRVIEDDDIERFYCALKPFQKCCRAYFKDASVVGIITMTLEYEDKEGYVWLVVTDPKKGSTGFMKMRSHEFLNEGYKTQPLNKYWLDWSSRHRIKSYFQRKI